MRKWLPEIGAFVAACAIGIHLDLGWAAFGVLWLAFDLMTASGKQLEGKPK